MSDRTQSYGPREVARSTTQYVAVTVRIPQATVSRFVQQARAQATSPAVLMREALLRSARRRNAQTHRGGA